MAMKGQDKNLIAKTIFWHLSLYKKALSLAPVKTTRVVFISVLSRIIHLLSFLLPLKAIMVAGSGEPPAFLVSLFPGITVTLLVTVLGSVTVIFYLVNISLLRLIDSINESGAKVIVARTQKIGGTRDVYSETLHYYKKIIRSLSSLFFVACVAIVLLLLYQKLFVVFVAVLLTPWLMVILAFQNPDGVMQSWFARNKIVLQQRWSFMVFISTFFVVVLDVLSENVELPILLAVISFILCRHALSAVNESVNIGFSLYSLREKVNSLLFFVSPAVYAQFSEHQYQGSLLTSEQVESISLDVLRGLQNDDSSDQAKLKWLSLQIFGVSCFKIIPDGDRLYSSEKDNLLLKVFQSKYKYLANRERLLLGNVPSGIRSLPQLLIANEVDGLECIVLKNSGTPLTTLDEYHNAIEAVLADIWAIDTSVEVIKAYMRSHQCGLSKLKRFHIESLSLACFEDRDKLVLSEFHEKFEAIKRIVLDLPRAIHNPELTMNVISEGEDGFPVILQWGRWSVEPIGTALWYYDFIDETRLDRIRKSVVEKRKDCRSLEIGHLLLSGELYLLWKLIGKQDLSAAMSSVHSILEIYKRLDSK
jgi:hypothetical protein